MEKNNEKKLSHDEWWEKIRAVSNANEKKHTPDYDKKENIHQKEEHGSKSISIKLLLLFIFLVIIAIIPRLYFIYFMSDPENGGVGWNGDTYHHWQIGYLTYTTGLHNGFLRLWDLKGMEYFWGPLDPLLLTAIFAISGSVNLVITRLLSTFFGVASLLLLSLLARRYWGNGVALATFVFGMFFPIAIQSDASGMLEPFGVFFMLLGIYFWPRKPLLTGLAWSLATMVRAEAWLFSMGLLAALIFVKEDSNKKILAFIGWTIPILFYMKYLLDNTGNAIYPLYWNFLANALGEWSDPTETLTALQMQVKPVLMILGVVSAVILLYILWKRPKGMLLLLLGLGNTFFVTAFMGFSHYIKGWEWWFPLIRFFVFPYIFLVMAVFILVAKISKFHKQLGVIFISIAGALAVLLSQFTWGPVITRFNETVPQWESSRAWGLEVGKYYEGGTVLFPEGDPNFTYTAVAYGKIHGRDILGQMFDPYFYIGEDAAYANWGKNKKEVFKWIKKYNIRLAVIANDSTRYSELIKREPYLFEKVSIIQNSRFEIWRVYPERISNYEKL